MAHPAQNEFIGRIRDIFPGHFRHARVLEIGSLDINGTIRGLFTDCDYTGIDVGPGPGVDVVCAGQDFDAPDESYDVVISCEAMEHNPYWAETFTNMVRLAKPGGLVLMTCATLGRKEHGTTRTTPADSPLTVAKGWDYYRNLRAGILQRPASSRRSLSPSSPVASTITTFISPARRRPYRRRRKRLWRSLAPCTGGATTARSRA